MNFCGVLLLFQMLISLTLVLSSEDTSDGEYGSIEDSRDSETDSDLEDVSSSKNSPVNNTTPVLPFEEPVSAVEFGPVVNPAPVFGSISEIPRSELNEHADILTNVLPVIESTGYSKDTISSKTFQTDSETFQAEIPVESTAEIPVESTAEESLNEVDPYFAKSFLAEAVLWQREDDFVENFLNFPQRVCNFIFTYLYSFSPFDHQYQY